MGRAGTEHWDVEGAWVASGPTQWHRVAGLAATGAVLAAMALWALFLRPQVLGGPVAYVLVSGRSMEPTFHDGDLVVVRRQPAYRVGQVVAFRVPRGEVGAGAVVIHRITGGSAGRGFVVRGDHRATPDLWRPRPGDVLGEQWIRIPGAARVVTFLWSPLRSAAAAGVLAFMIVALGPVGTETRPDRTRRLTVQPAEI